MKLPVDYNKLTQQERRQVREQYEYKQMFRCYHCKQALSIKPHHDKKIDWSLFPKGFLNHPVHLHHDHRTGMTIGAVHAYCNAVLWQYHNE